MDTTTTTPLHIGELANLLALNPKTIRYYEQIGLLPKPQRSETGYRLYKPKDKERLGFIKSAQQTGLSLGEIKEILNLRDNGKAPCQYVAERIKQRLAHIDQEITDLKKLKNELSELDQHAHKLSLKTPPPNKYCHILQKTKT